MRKYPKKVGVTSIFKSKNLFVYYTFVNVGGLIGSYIIWKNMLTSSDFRFTIHNYCRPILNSFYSIYKFSASNPPITYESDLEQWKLENKIQ